MTELPAGWEKTTLGECCETQLGKTLNRSKQTGKATIPYLRNINVQWTGFDLSDLKQMDIPLDERDKFTACSGDLLVTEGGEPGRCQVWRANEPIGFQNALHRVRPREGLNVDFLKYQIQHLVSSGQLEHLFSGVTIKHFSQSKFRSVPILLPPLAEQQRIVTRIEELEELIARTSQNINETQTKVDKFIIASTAKLFSQEFKTSELGEVASIKAGPFGSSLKKDSYRPSGYKVYGQEQVLRNDPHFGDYFINQDKYDALETCAISPGDVLVSLVGTIGKTLILPKAAAPGVINPRLVRIRPGKQVTAGYVAAFIEAPMTKARLSLESHGGTMSILNSTMLKALVIPVPPLKIQGEIVESLERVQENHNFTTLAIEHLQTKLKLLRTSILSQALSGELVPQAPSDDSTTALLDRIETAQSQPSKKSVAS